MKLVDFSGALPYLFSMMARILRASSRLPALRQFLTLGGPLLALIAATALALPGCAREQPEQQETVTPATPSSGKVLASWDGGAITTDDLDTQMERLPPRVRFQLQSLDRKRQFVEQQVMTKLLLAEGKRRGYDSDEGIRQQVASLERRLIVQKVMKDLQQAPQITDEQIRAHYDKNRGLYSTTQVRASHILVKSEAEARKLLEQIREDPTQFEALAREKSTDRATKDRGGDLGFFGQGRMVPAFEKAAFALKNVGDVSDVVKSPFGYHIIKLTGRKEGSIKPFDEVKERIRIRLLAEARRQHVDEELTKLKQAVNLKIDEEGLEAWEIPGASPKSAPVK